MARISPKNFTPIHAHESSRVENKRNVFLPFARSPLFLSRFLYWEGFYYGFLQDRALAEESGTPRDTHFPSSLDMGHRGP